MPNIVITDGITTVTMPQIKNIVDAGSVVAKESVMASGLVVRDVIGFRHGITAVWDYVPAATITALIALLRTGNFLTVTFPDVSGLEQTKVCSVAYPAFEVFCYRNNVAVWHNCTLTILAQEVTA